MADDLLNDDQYASDAANLPALRKPVAGDWSSVIKWAMAVNQHLTVRRGALNSFERGATMRDLENFKQDAGLKGPGASFSGRTPSGNISVVVKPGAGNTFQIDIEAFSEELKKTKLWKRLMSSVNDPNRFDDLPEQVRLLVTGNLAEQGLATRADIQRVESKIVDDTKSLALQSEQVTASFQSAVSGIRTTQFAFASATRSQAGQITTITARIDDVDGAGATIEEAYIATADSIDGLDAQYTLKVTAGGAVAGFGLGATTPVSGNAVSAAIFAVDKFAIVASSYSGGLTNTPPAGSIPFGVSGGNVYMSGNLLVGGTISSSGIYLGSGVFQVNAGTGVATMSGIVVSTSTFGNLFNPGVPAINAGGDPSSNQETIKATSTSSNAAAHGIRGANSSYGTSGLVGMAGAWDFYADGGGTNYGPFTGAHEGLVPLQADLTLGDIVRDVRCISRRGWSNTIFEIDHTDTLNQADAVGVLVWIGPVLEDAHPPAALVEGRHDPGGVNMPIMSGAYYEVAATHQVVAFNALGEGQMNVCGRGGDIAAGDFITSSTLRGKGQRQADDLLHNYTVARAREAVAFSHADEVKQVACIYLAG